MDRTDCKNNTPSTNKPIVGLTESDLQPDDQYASSKHETLRQLCEEETNILKMLEMIKHEKNKLVLERLTLVNELTILQPKMSKQKQDTFLSNAHTTNVVPSVHRTVEPHSAAQPTTVPNQISTHTASSTSNIYGQHVKFIKHDSDHSRKTSVQKEHASLLEQMVDGDFYADNEQSCSSNSSRGSDWLDEWTLSS